MKTSPKIEAERLCALQNYAILDTEPEPDFDDLTRLAASVCAAPVALITFVDEKRQWIKAGNGLIITETPREIAFCAHTILNPEKLFVVEDAAKDPRFCASPLVTGEPRIRFYAGAPLISPEGFALGSLCIIDYVPRALSAEQANNLALLARQVVSQMELRKTLKANHTLAEHCRRVIMEASDGIHLYDFDGRIKSVNQKFCEITGRSEAELLKMRVQDLVAAEDLAKLPVRFAELRAGRQMMSERRIVRPDKSIVAVEISGKMLDENTIQGIARDITERVHTQELLRQSERRYRDLTEKSLGLICTHDFEGNLLSLNPASAEALGYAAEDLVGKKIIDALPLHNRHLFGAYLEELRRRGESSGVVNVVTKNGDERVWKYNNVVYEESGGAPFVLGHAQDITELKKAENELRALFAAMQDVILVLDKDGRYVEIAPTNPALLYLPSNEIVGKRLDEVFPSEQAAFFKSFITAALETSQTQKFEYILPIDGREVWFAGNATRMTADTVLFVARDITERKQMENDLRTARDAALESARSKSAFLTNVTHELRTPMNGVLGMTELLLDTPLDRTQRDYAETIRQSGDALLTVINDILDLAKIEAGKLRFETIDFDVREIVESTVEMLAGRAFGKNIEIASLIGDKVPRTLRGDPGRLRQVLTNLIGNAVKFTESGGVRVEATLCEDSPELAVLRFDIIDTGIGIDENNLKNLFQPFVQADNSMTRQFGGTGLGLVISKQIVGMMNGEISVESRLNVGSRFSFTACFSKKQTTPGEAMSSPPVVKGQLDGRRILIADASDVVRANLEQYCRIWNLTASGAANGADALRQMRIAAEENRPFDFIVVDLNLPDWDGFSLVERIKTETVYAAPRIIVTTSYGQRGDAAEAHKIGIVGYLTKPVRGSQLLECLSAVLTENSQSNNNRGSASPAELITRHSLREAKAEKEILSVPPGEKPFRVLVVEDNVVNRRIVLEQLKRIGVNADFAVDGVDALEKTAERDYELLFMDCQMPRMDGYEATREIRRREREKFEAGEAVSPLVIIALTAHTLAGEREKCFSAGMNDYLTKPAKISQFSTLLRFWQATLSPEMDVSSGNFRLQIETNESPENLPASVSKSYSPPKAGGATNDFDTEIKRLYITETTGQIEEIEKAIRSGDCAAISRFAHAARGNSLAVGAAKIADVAALIEELGNKQEIEKIPDYLQDLKNEFFCLA